jgi:hypothetical protein
MEFHRGEKDLHFHTRCGPKRRSATLTTWAPTSSWLSLQMSKMPNAVLKDEYLKTDGKLANIVKTFTAYETRMLRWALALPALASMPCPAGPRGAVVATAAVFVAEQTAEAGLLVRQPA